MIQPKMTILNILFLVGAACCSQKDELPEVASGAADEEVTDGQKDDTSEGDDSEDTTSEDSNDENTTLTSFPLCDGITQPAPPFMSSLHQANSGKCGVFLEENGLVLMEAENTQSDYESHENKWVFLDEATTVAIDGDIHRTTTEVDHRGSGYLKFTGSFWNQNEQPSKLIYTFKIQNTGSYRMQFRSLKGLNEEGDKHNDCFIKMEGDYEVGQMKEGCIDTNGKEVLLKGTYHLEKDSKFFGASNEGWKPRGLLDVHLPYKPWAVYTFKAGETYTLTITGRSTKYFIDRIIIYDLHKYKWGEMNQFLNKATQSLCLEE
ncbi:MAG: hypothetical protein AAGA66_12685 [Bacteroidota bacterium]